MKNYYTLFELDLNLKKWVIAFGDYSLSIVNDEKQDLKDMDFNDRDLAYMVDDMKSYKLPLKQFRVEMSGDSQEEIEAKQEYLNTNWDFDLNRFKRTDKV